MEGKCGWKRVWGKGVFFAVGRSGVVGSSDGKGAGLKGVRAVHLSDKGGPCTHELTHSTVRKSGKKKIAQSESKGNRASLRLFMEHEGDGLVLKERSLVIGVGD